MSFISMNSFLPTGLSQIYEVTETPPIKAGDVTVSWGTSHQATGNGVTATGTIKVGGQLIGTVVVDHGNNTVTVTEDQDPQTGKPGVEVFSISGDGWSNDIVAKGNISQTIGAEDPYNSFIQTSYQEVTLESPDLMGTGGITVEIANNIHGGDANDNSTGIGAVIFTPSQTSPSGYDATVIAGGGLGPNASTPDAKQLTVDFTHNIGDGDVETDHVSPNPPSASLTQKTLNFISNWF